ncbi:MAG: 30S ribosomal protein S19 [Planctomycetota bacterium]|nr:MAG: 30S ribosomal protein S19 [Planctomycetota bacterium]
MSRSIKKGPWIEPRLHRKFLKARHEGSKQPIKTWARASTILPEYVGYTFNVHNGKTFKKIFITEDMVGHRLGEFSPTRTFRGHSKGK